MECTPTSKYRCELCDKSYSSRQNLWKHNTKFHKSDNQQEINNIPKKCEIQQKNDKYNCKECKTKFNNINDLDSHIKLKCKPNIKHNNVFKFNTNTFGKNKYPNDNGGEIYIIQTDFSLKGYYKIGVTTNLYHRMTTYRCGAVIEPRIHCYFPIKDIKKSDSLMKKKLLKYNIKREIYKIDNLAEVTKLLKELQKEMNSEELEVLPEIKNCDVVECEYCNTIYTSNYELKIHLESCEELRIADKNQHDININQHTTVKSKLVCKYCKKKFSYIQSRWRHEIKCKTESTTLVAQQNEELKKQMDEMKQQIANLLKSCKIHPKTLQKINNQINNNNTNNGTINNNVIMKFGNVNINEVLSNKQIMSILHKPFVSVEECVKMIHFNDKLPQYNNIYITNMKDDLMYIYDGTKFTTTTKSDAINDLIDNYSDQIEISFDDNKDKMTEYKIKCVENYLKLINSNKEYIDQHNKKYTNFKTYKVGDVKRLIYDKSDPKKFAMVCKGIDV
jgi:hypothetical protein